MAELDPIWNILVVEDEALLADEIEERLRRSGHQVVGVADTGEAAITMAQTHLPDLVLMDIRLKGQMDGIEAASRIYARTGIPVIFTTAHSDQETLRRAQTSAQFGYVIKPFREQDILLAMRLAMHRHHAEASLRKTALTHDAILASITDSVVVADHQGVVRFMNIKAEEVLGWHIADALGLHLERVVALLEESSHAPVPMSKLLSDSQRQQGGRPCILVDRRGHELNAEVTATTVRDRGGKEIGLVLLIRDITEKKLRDELIWRQAHLDDLTGLPNRSSMREHLARELQRARVNGGQLAMLLMDLDHFKEVNDTLGHAEGDRLLQEAAQRIRGCLGPHDILTRPGGDEFAVILPGVIGDKAIQDLVDRILDALDEPFVLDTHTCQISASIGVAVFPRDTQSPDDLLKYADQAMYAAKADGRNRHKYFTADMRRNAEYRRGLVNDLRGALERQQLVVYYQPIVELSSGEVVKAEALLRWQHPVHGLISPLEFIPLAEESGLIHEIGEWVFDQAAAMAARLLKEFERSVQISVNVSAVQFASMTFGAIDWAHKLDQLSVPRQCIAIEITESVLIEDSNLVKGRLLGFRNAGMEVSIDDFGTGFSSLSYIQEFDIDYLKIDASFTRGIADNADNLALTEAIIVMAHKLGIKTVAEGVETGQQCGILARLGCDYAQGYLFSRPVPRDEFEAYLTR